VPMTSAEVMARVDPNGDRPLVSMVLDQPHGPACPCARCRLGC
jgi:hypothetical protein